MKAIVIGGGIMGLGIARQLAAEGIKVSLFERNTRLGAEASRASAGMIGPQSEAMVDDAYFAATLVSRDLWPEFAQDLAKETGLDLGFSNRGAIHLAFGAAYEQRLEAKYLWQKKRAGRLERLEGAERSKPTSMCLLQEPGLQKYCQTCLRFIR
jgi:glycine oxidase